MIKQEAVIIKDPRVMQRVALSMAKTIEQPWLEQEKPLQASDSGLMQSDVIFMDTKNMVIWRTVL